VTHESEKEVSPLGRQLYWHRVLCWYGCRLFHFLFGGYTLKYIVPFAVVFLAACATTQEPVKCSSMVIDEDNHAFVTEIPHSCGASVNVNSAQEGIRIRLVESHPINYIYVNGL